MVVLYGQALTAYAARQRLGRMDAAAGVTLCRFEDGPERGVRFLDVRTGTGLAFSVLVDRGMDLGALSFRGIPIGWQSPSGFRAPWLTAADSEGGRGMMRLMSGFWVTCGLDHARQPELGHPLHGRGAMQPARLAGYGADWQEDELLLWAEADIRQATLLGENLLLRRRIESRAGSNAVTVTDQISNEGFTAVPHMLLYHLNVGWPLLDAGSRLVVTGRAEWTAPGLTEGAGQHVSAEPAVAGEAGECSVTLFNDRLRLGLRIGFDPHALPWLQQWHCFDEGVLALGIEPCTNRLASRSELIERGELRYLAPREYQRYVTRIVVLDGSAGKDG